MRSISSAEPSPTPELERRIAELEKAIREIGSSVKTMSEYIEGWERAARFCGLSSVTLRRRVAEGEVAPCSYSRCNEAASRTLTYPVFRVSDLRAWREGKLLC